MVDSLAPAAEQLKKCAVHHSISQKDLERLLGVIIESLQVGESVRDPETQLPAIYPEWLDIEYVREHSPNNTTPAGFYVNPRLQRRNEETPANILALKDVCDIFKSIAGLGEDGDNFIDEKIRSGEYGGYDLLDEEQANLINRIKNDYNGELLPPDLNYLRGDSRVLLSIIATLHAGSAAEGEEVETVLTLPDEFKALLEGDLNLGVSWEWVKPLIEDVLPTKLNAPTVVFRYNDQKRAVAVTEIRFFLNNWLRKFYEEYQQRFREVGLELPETKLFDATNKLVAYFDLPYWVELDQDIITFISKELSPLIEQYLKRGQPTGVGLGYQKENTEDEEKKEKLTENIKNVEEADDLLERFSQAGKSYSQESERLTTILLPQLFNMHGISRDLTQLGQIDDNSLFLVEREFRQELENVLRTLTPQEFALLSERGGSLEFRLIVLRKLYGKLSTNPRFIASIQEFKENYVSYLEERAADGDQAAQRELNKLERQINLPDQRFDEELAKSEKVPPEEWTKELSKGGKGVGEVTLQEFADLHKISQEDFRFLATRLVGNDIDFPTLLRNLDVIIAERWSPEQIRGLDPGGSTAIFGLVLPDYLTQDGHRFQLFLNLCAEYLYARRQHLADHYQLDAISRQTGSGSTDLASLQAAQEMAERYKEYGGGEALVVGRASDSKRVEEYQHGNKFGVGISGVHSETKEQRKGQLETHKNTTRARFHEMSIDDKRKQLQSLGLLTPDNEQFIGDDELRMAQLLDTGLNEDYDDGVRGLDDFSYYEDQDNGYVQEQLGTGQRSIPQRYGRPGGRSLLKGALNLKNRFQKAQKRIKQAKKIAKAAKKLADKGLEKVEAAAASVVMGPLAQNKTLRRGILGVLTALVLDTLNMIQQGFFAKVGAFLGGALGGIAGGAAGGVFVIPGAIVGTFGGARLGHGIDQWFANTFGGAPEVRVSSPGLSLPLAKQSADTLTGSAKVSGGEFAKTSTNAWPAIATSGGFMATVGLAGAVITASIQPPPLGTIGASGLESEYVIVEKVITDPANFTGDVVPSSITYTISVETKGNYQIEIVNFQDQIQLTPNTEVRGSEAPPAALSCPDFTFANLATRVIGPNDGKVQIGTCTITLDQSYHDTGIFNKFTMQFKVSENGQAVTNSSPDFNCGETSDTFCAISGVQACLGDCPLQQEGCWPTSGRLTQGPGGEGSHRNTAAIDIGARLGTNVYATFDGTAYAFDTYAAEPSNQGLIDRTGKSGVYSKSYGKHVVLITNQGFALLFAHLNSHSSTLRLGTPVPVTAGTILGYVGNSGSTTGLQMGMHLHYEYRVPTGNSWQTIRSTNGAQIIGVLPNETGEAFVFNGTRQVTSCYDASTPQ